VDDLTSVVASLRESEEFLRRLLASSDDCIKLLDLDGRLLFISANGQALLGIDDVSAHIGADWTAWWGADRDLAAAAIVQARAGGRGQFEAFAATMDGTPKWWNVVVTPILGAGGAPERLLASSRDVTSRRHDAEALARSEASLRALTHSLPGVVWSARADGTLDYVNQAWLDYTGLSHAEALGMSWGPLVHPDDRATTIAAWTTSVRERRVHEHEYRLRRASDGVYRWHVSRAVPVLDERGDVVKWYGTTTDIDAAKRLYEHERRVATRLQRASLPRELPACDALQFDAVYVPGSSEAEIGGDWYDAFALPDGRIVLSVGDVMGSGLDAAVTMGKVRQSMRVAALLDADPLTMLRVADATFRMDDAGGLATALAAVIDPAAMTMRYACAGHYPPLVRDRAGAVRELPADPGLPLGLRGAAGSRVDTLELEDGELLVLYTDGLIESTRDAHEGERRLHAALRAAHARDPRPAQSIHDAVLVDGSRDDVAILTIRVGSVRARAGERATRNAAPAAAVPVTA
jgi:PAS domain S-box-containing protein